LGDIRETGSVEEAAEHKAERRRQQTRTQAAQTSRNQHRRYEEQVGSLLLKNRIEREASAKGDCDHDRCQSVMEGARPLQGCPRQRVPNAGIGKSLSEARHLLPYPTVRAGKSWPNSAKIPSGKVLKEDI
jgi:hypothetical protein